MFSSLVVSCSLLIFYYSNELAVYLRDKQVLNELNLRIVGACDVDCPRVVNLVLQARSGFVELNGPSSRSILPFDSPVVVLFETNQIPLSKNRVSITALDPSGVLFLD